MSEPYTILMQKGDNGVVDILEDFGVACVSFPFEIGREAKEPEVRDWPGEDGEDAYLPPAGLPLKAYDIEAEMCYKGVPNQAALRMTALRDYLTGADGDGAELKIYNPQTKIGRQKCHFLAIEDVEYFADNTSEALTFTLKMRVCDPRTQVTLAREVESVEQL